MKRPGRWHAAAICRTCAFGPLAATSRLIRNGVKPTRRLTSAFIALACFANSQPSPASETITYTYDARGRVVQVSHGGPINQGSTATYQYDKADNRANVSVATSWTSTASRTGDFNGDGRSDILWRDDTAFGQSWGPGTLTDWLSSSTGNWVDNWSYALGGAGVEWKIAAVADVNSDGRSDILWWRADGTLGEWFNTASGGWAGGLAYGVTPDWKIAGVGDFNGDGRPDILWRKNDGQFSNWLGGAGGTFSDNSSNSWAPVATDWKISGVGDFNGDGRSDVLWRQDGTTAMMNWLGTAIGGFTTNSANYSDTAGEWKVVGIGDFNGDGRDDILWRREDGTLIDSLATATGGFVSNAGNFATVMLTNWRAAEIGDFNGDGRDDILWRSTTGDLTDWLATSTGAFNTNSAANASVGTNWNIEPK